MEEFFFEEEALSFTNLTSMELLKSNGELSGKDIIIQNANKCQIFLLDYCSQVTIDSCQNTLFVIGPTSQQVLIKNCQNCQITASCKALEVSVSTDLTLYIFIATNPKINNSKNITFAPFNYAYPMQDSHLKIAKIPLDTNYWNEVKDLTIEENQAHWKLLEPEKFKLEQKEVLNIPVKPVNPFPLPMSYKQKGSLLGDSPSETSKEIKIPEIIITDNTPNDINEEKKNLVEIKQEALFNSPPQDESRKNYDDFKFNSPSIEEVKTNDNIPNLVKLTDSSPEISMSKEINNKIEIPQPDSKDAKGKTENFLDEEIMNNGPQTFEENKEVNSKVNPIQNIEKKNSQLYPNLETINEMPKNDFFKEESKNSKMNESQSNNEANKPETNFNFDEFKGEEQKININMEGFSVPEDSEFQKEEKKMEEKSDMPELGFHKYDEDELEPSKREKSPGKEYDFTAEEQERVNKVMEEEKIRMNLIYEKQMKEQNDKEEKKEYGRNWCDEWKVKRKKTLLEKRTTNKKDEVAMIESLKEKKKSPNPWERVVTMIELKEGNYPGTKSVARMRQSILGRKNDIKTGLSKIDN